MADENFNITKRYVQFVYWVKTVNNIQLSHILNCFFKDKIHLFSLYEK